MKNSDVIAIEQIMVNVFLIKSTKGYILVDTGQPGAYKKLAAKMKKKGVDPASIELIIITHPHQDHTANINAFKKLSGAKVLIQKHGVEYLKNGTNPPLTPDSSLGKFLSKLIKDKKLEGTDPDIIVEDDFSLEEFGVKGKIIMTPGHTADSISIVLDNGTAIIGDIIMGGVFNAKKPHMPFVALDADKNTASIKKLLEYPVEVFYAGHGGPFKVNDVKKLMKGR